MRLFSASGLLVCLLVLLPIQAFAQPQVHLVIPATNPAQVQRPVQELTSLLQRVFQAHVTTGADFPAEAPYVILLGNPANNAAINGLAGDKWPTLSEQGHLVRSLSRDKQQVLVIGGENPQSLAWGVSELAYHFGCRVLLQRDVDPLHPPAFNLQGLDRVIEPAPRLRAWRVLGDASLAHEAWGLADQQKLFAQLSKLKFNTIQITLNPWQPFLSVESHGSQQATAILFGGEHFPTSGDTAGRKAFGKLQVFENPDVPGALSLTERQAAGQKLVRGLIEAAHAQQMQVILELSPLMAPTEFAPHLPGSSPVPERPGISIAPGSTVAPGSPWMKYATAQIQAALKAYPDADYIQLQPGLATSHAKATGADASTPVPAELWSLIEEPRRLSQKVVTMPPFTSCVLPRLSAVSSTTWQGKVPEQLASAISVRNWFPGDVNAQAHALSRLSSDASYIPESAVRDLWTPLLEPEAVERVVKGFSQIEQATSLIARHDIHFARPAPDMLLKLMVDEPVPDWWIEARTLYTGAMDEMYRGIQGTRDASVRPLLLYHAKRFEFAVHYLTALEALRLAGQAKAKENSEEFLTQLEKGTESIYNALTAYGDVARDQSDRAVIAILNAYGFRPLQKTLEGAEEMQ